MVVIAGQEDRAQSGNPEILPTDVLDATVVVGRTEVSNLEVVVGSDFRIETDARYSRWIVFGEAVFRANRFVFRPLRVTVEGRIVPDCGR